jgi:FMN phosphatase YigB (HAD superfamily)
MERYITDGPQFADAQNPEQVVTLLDIDGTTSDTATHMSGLNERLATAFPAIGAALDGIKQQRQAFRNEHGHLSFAEQDALWQQRYPGTTSHSQLDIYRTFAPDVFDNETTAAVHTWLDDAENFGYAEYDDVQPMLEGLRRIGSPAVLFTLGQYETPTGEPGWQQRKIQSAPSLRDLPSHVTDTLPAGGKGETIAQAYNADQGLFHFPRTDGEAPMITRGLVMVDDSTHNLEHLPPQALGILIDRQGKKAHWKAPANVHVVDSLEEVPALVQAYAAQRVQQ